MKNSPYLDKPVLSERERAIADNARESVLYYRDKIAKANANANSAKTDHERRHWHSCAAWYRLDLAYWETYSRQFPA